ERAFQVAASWPELADRVTDRDDAVGKDVRIEATAVDEVLDQAGPGHRLQVQAWLAELDAVTLDLTDLEALADQVVEPYATHRQLTAGLTSFEPALLKDPLFDPRERSGGRGPPHG